MLIRLSITIMKNVFKTNILFIKPPIVTIKFGAPIDLKPLPKEQRRHIGSQVQGIIGGMLKENSLANVES